MNHGVHGSTGKFIDKYGIIMMRVAIDFLVEFIAKKKWFIVKIELNVHACKWKE